MTNLDRLVEDLRIKFRLLFNQLNSSTSDIINYYNLTQLEAGKAAASAIEAELTLTQVEIQIQNTGTWVQWKRVVDTTWNNLILIASLQGEDGIVGHDGLEVELQNDGTNIQWRLIGGSWVNLILVSELKGEPGGQGDAFTYADFTPEQLVLLKGEKGDTFLVTDLTPEDLLLIKGEQGIKGDAFTYLDFTPEQLLTLKGEQGIKGDAFVYSDFTPEQLALLVGAKGDAFIYTDFTPEQLVLLKGDQGIKGDSFLYTDFTPEQLALLKGEKGDAFVYTDFTQGQLDLLKGLKGDHGDAFVYADFSPEQLLALKGDQGIQGNAFIYTDFTQGQLDALKGVKGDDFVYTDFTSEQLLALKGAKGDTGNTGETGALPILETLTGKTTPVDTDKFLLEEVATGNAQKKTTWLNIKDTLASFFSGSFNLKEDLSNKVTSIAGTSTDGEYPSAKLVYDKLALKQDTLVSDSNIKTVGGVTLLGSGNIVTQNIVWHGVYNNSHAYVVNDGVSYLGSSYICKLASEGFIPTNSTYWDILASMGIPGVSGISGAVEYPFTTTGLTNPIVVTHGFNGYPAVQIIDNAGILLTTSSITSVTHNSPNQVTIVLASDKTGIVVCTLGGVSTSVVLKSSNYTLLPTDNLCLVNAACTITLPTPTGLQGKTFSIKHITNSGTIITIDTEDAALIDDVSSVSMTAEGRTLVFMTDGTNYFLVSSYDPKKLLYTYSVGLGGDFTTIDQAVTWFNSSGIGDSELVLDGGEHPVATSVHVHSVNGHMLNIKGLDSGITSLNASTGLAGSPMFDVITPCNFRQITFNGDTLAGYGDSAEENCFNFITTVDLYCEISDVIINNFYIALNDTIGTSIYMFNFIIDTCQTGVLINYTTNSPTSFPLTDVEIGNFSDCPIGINLVKTGAAKKGNFILSHLTFIHSSGSMTGINYDGVNYIYGDIANILNCTYNNIGNFSSGFDFSNIRDINISVVSNQGIHDSSYLAKIVLPLVNATATGNIIDNFNCGYTSSAIGDLVYLSSSSTWLKADNTTSVTTYQGLLGIALEVKATGTVLKVALSGSFVYLTTFPTLTIGNPIYMSTNGAIVVAQPSASNSAIRIIGWAIASNRIFFCPSPDYITHI